MLQIEPVTLTGQLVRLEPLQAKHTEDLYKVSQDATIWLYMPMNPSHSLSVMKQWIATTLQVQATGAVLPFAIIELATQRSVGSTRYLNIDAPNRGLEIGWTWLASSVRRTGVNTECKYLLLQHAFETLQAIRVQFKTDSRNHVSQRAIERLGAVKEGVLRNHMIMPDNYYRHSVYYSIIESEWPGVKSHLAAKMQRTP